MRRAPGREATRAHLVGALARGLRRALVPEVRAFERALDAPAGAQDAALRRMVAALAGTEYGRAHGLAAGDGYGAFAARLPIVTYEDLLPWVERQRGEGGSILVPGPVRAWEKTSGSAGPAKYVPCPAALRRSFGRLFRLWLADLLAHGPALASGRTWISVSPRPGPPETAAHGAPIGLDSDLEYAGGGLRRLLALFMVVPPGVSRLRDPESAKRVLAGALVAGRPEVVSVWSPTFLLALLDWITRHRDVVARDLHTGAVAVEGRSFPLMRPAPGVLRALGAMAVTGPGPIPWPEVLPGLTLVSCWADGPAAAPAAELARLLPGVAIQGKGLLATEAPITVPWTAAGGCLPLLHEVFLEFADEAGAIRRLHELAPGEEYALIVTAPGGFARYRIGDRVRVAAIHRAAPVLAFVGREGHVSDLAGEKLDERFVRAALDELPLAAGSFRALLPVRRPGAPAHYVLVVDRAAFEPAAAAGAVAASLDAALQRAHRYREARVLGQLDPPVVVGLAAAGDRVLDALAAAGTPRGAVKPTCLLRDPALTERVLA